MSLWTSIFKGAGKSAAKEGAEVAAKTAAEAVSKLPASQRGWATALRLSGKGAVEIMKNPKALTGTALLGYYGYQGVENKLSVWDATKKLVASGFSDDTQSAAQNGQAAQQWNLTGGDVSTAAGIGTNPMGISSDTPNLPAQGASFFERLLSGDFGGIVNDLFSNIKNGKFGWMQGLGLLAGGWLMFGGKGWMQKIMGGLLMMLTIGNLASPQQQLAPAQTASGGGQKIDQADQEAIVSQAYDEAAAQQQAAAGAQRGVG